MGGWLNLRVGLVDAQDVKILRSLTKERTGPWVKRLGLALSFAFLGLGWVSYNLLGEPIVIVAAYACIVAVWVFFRASFGQPLTAGESIVRMLGGLLLLPVSYPIEWPGIGQLGWVHPLPQVLVPLAVEVIALSIAMAASRRTHQELMALRAKVSAIPASPTGGAGRGALVFVLLVMATALAGLLR